MQDKKNRIFCGVDEVGRGPLAGPVVAACVIANEDSLISIGVNDSKKLSEKARQQMAKEICKVADSWSIGVCSVEEIDKINILQASLEAMRKSVLFSPVKAEHAWVDGRDRPNLDIDCTAVINGDSKIPCIAAASIIAKVYRDSLMQVYAKKYPGYGLEKHKGYGTKSHLMALSELGITSIHRRSFKPVDSVYHSFLRVSKNEEIA